MDGEIEFPEIPRTVQETRTVPDHHVLFVFANDEDAQKFAEWMTDAGWPAFGYWLDSQ